MLFPRKALEAFGLNELLYRKRQETRGSVYRVNSKTLGKYPALRSARPPRSRVEMWVNPVPFAILDLQRDVVVCPHQHYGSGRGERRALDRITAVLQSSAPMSLRMGDEPADFVPFLAKVFQATRDSKIAWRDEGKGKTFVAKVGEEPGVLTRPAPPSPNLGERKAARRNLPRGNLQEWMTSTQRKSSPKRRPVSVTRQRRRGILDRERGRRAAPRDLRLGERGRDGPGRPKRDVLGEVCRGLPSSPAALTLLP